MRRLLVLPQAKQKKSAGPVDKTERSQAERAKLVALVTR
jgi:hypothetical protein